MLVRISLCVVIALSVAGCGMRTIVVGELNWSSDPKLLHSRHDNTTYELGQMASVRLVQFEEVLERYGSERLVVEVMGVVTKGGSGDLVPVLDYVRLIAVRHPQERYSAP